MYPTKYIRWGDIEFYKIIEDEHQNDTFARL